MKIFVEDNILIKDKICSEYNFKSPYSATVVEKIKAAGMEITENKNEADAVLCSETETSEKEKEKEKEKEEEEEEYMFHVRPTYGAVSRFGLVADVSSMDRIGVSAHEIDTAFYVLSVIAGHDKNDGTSYPTEKYNYSIDGIDLGNIKSINSPEFKFKEYLKQVYLIISAAEFSGNIARFDGIKFGYRTENFKNADDIIINSRSESFPTETKIKCLMGTYVLSEEQFEKYYLKATKIRRLIKQELGEIFKQYDLIILPPCDKAKALVDLTGCPAIIFDGKIIIAKEFDENKLFAYGNGKGVAENAK